MIKGGRGKGEGVESQEDEEGMGFERRKCPRMLSDREGYWLSRANNRSLDCDKRP